eukprot:Selendium_serpulae@DN5312_c0_g1_i1.p1
MNSFPVILGAVGTPIWYGLSGVQGADEAMYIVTAHKASFIMMLTAPIVMPMILLVPMRWKSVLKNMMFISISAVSCPCFSYLLTLGGYSGATTYEFGSLLGGAFGFFLTGALAWYGVGLKACDLDNDYRYPIVRNIDAEGEEKDTMSYSIDLEELSNGKAAKSQSGLFAQSPHSDATGCDDKSMLDAGEQAPQAVVKEKTFVTVVPAKSQSAHSDVEPEVLGPDQLGFTVKRLLGYTFPFYFTIFLLVVTRIEALQIKGWLQSKTPSFTVPLNGLGDFKCSASFVLQLIDTFGIVGGTVFETFYIPFILPFLVVGMITCFMHWNNLRGNKWKVIGDIYKDTFTRCLLPFVALIGANAFSLMLRKESEDYDAPTTVIGGTLAAGLSYAWIPIAPLLGALGSFFSGSATVSALTFGDIQRVAAETLGVSTTSMLALQSIGSAFGNMTCIFNILSVKTILGNDEPEGTFLKKTAPIMAFFWLIVSVLGGPLYFATTWGEGMNFSDGPIPA